MGSGGSKLENSQLVVLCKERKEFIRAVCSCRYDLASAHILYFQSLLNVGEALNRFVEEELAIVLDEPSDENSHLVFSTSDSESEMGSLTDYVHGVSEVDEGPEPTRCRDRDVHYMRRGSMVIPSKIYEQPHVVTVQRHESSNSFSRFSKYVSRLPSCQLTPLLHDNLRYGQESSYICKSIPIDSHSRYRPNSHMVCSGATLYTPQNDYIYQYVYEGSFVGSTDMPNNHYNHVSSASPVHSPDPAPPKASTWDYLNPFSMIDNVYFDPYDHDKDETGSGGEDHDLRDVREREGIPDLEDEIDKISVDGVFDGRELGDTGGVSVCGVSREAPSKTEEDGEVAEKKVNKTSQDSFETREKEIKSNPETSEKDTKRISETFISNNLDDVKKEGSGSNIDQPLNLEGETLGAIPTHSSRDLRDVVKEIKYAFETAYDYGREVSVMLEAGKLPYQPVSCKLKEFASWIFNFLSASVVTSSHPPRHMLSNRSASRLVEMAKAHKGIIEDDICRKFGDLSSTLEKLYAWEKKLYEEVTGEEKLRFTYDKECRRLKYLDDRGAESNKIDKVQASINKLLSKINVAVAAVDMISTRIYKLRDEELYPQLTELIEGFIRMWTSLVKCHQKQFQDISNAQSHFHQAKVGTKEDSTSKATLNFEVEILSWCTHFIDYVNIQKAFIKCLNEWLTRCLFQEPEETPDGIAPFSPSRIGAPPIFVVCNDWYHALEKISETGVSKAIHDFASNLHLLRDKQDEEQHQRLKVEYLLKDLDKRLRFLCRQRGIDYDSDIDVATEFGLGENLASMRKRLGEQKARHEEAIGEVNEAASSCIGVGLVRVFEALEMFGMENLKAYEQIRILRGRELDA